MTCPCCKSNPLATVDSVAPCAWDAHLAAGGGTCTTCDVFLADATRLEDRLQLKHNNKNVLSWK